MYVRAEVKGRVCEMGPAGFESGWKLIRLATINEICSITATTEVLLGINSMSSCFHTVECDPRWRSRTVWNSAILTPVQCHRQLSAGVTFTPLDSSCKTLMNPDTSAKKNFFFFYPLTAVMTLSHWVNLNSEPESSAWFYQNWWVCYWWQNNYGYHHCDSSFVVALSSSRGRKKFHKTCGCRTEYWTILWGFLRLLGATVHRDVAIATRYQQ